MKLQTASFRLRLTLGVVLLSILLIDMNTGFRSIENSFTAFRSAITARNASKQIVYIGIDKASIDQIGVWPWPRSIYGAAIQRLLEAEVGEIFFDIDFSTPSTKEEDRKFADALILAGEGVILPVFLQYHSADHNSNRLVLSKPIREFEDISWPAAVNVLADADGLVRSIPASIKHSGEEIPSAVLLLAGESQNSRRDINIDFSISPKSVPTYSFAKLLSHEIPNAALKNKTIVIGAEALELKDNVTVPNHGLITGPMLQILAAETLIQDRNLKTFDFTNSAMLYIGLFVLIQLLFSLGAIRARITSLFAVAICGEVASFYLLKEYAYILNTIPILLICVFGLFVCLFDEIDLKSWMLKIVRLDVTRLNNIFERVINDSNDGFLIVTQSGKTLVANQNFRNVFGLKDDLDLNEIPSRLPKTIKESLSKFLNSNSQESCNSPTKTTLKLTIGGQEKFVSVGFSSTKIPSPNPSVDENTRVFTITASDVTEESVYKKKIEHAARYDLLTGAELRAEFLENVGRDLKISRTKNVRIFVFAIARFREINQLLGSDVGDELISRVAKRLRNITPRVAGVARLDGANLAIRMDPRDQDTGYISFIEHLLQELRRPYRVLDQLVSVDFFVGTADRRKSGAKTSRELLSDAEMALQQSRMSGVGVVVDTDPELRNRQKRARKIERELDLALETNQIQVLYQPQVKAECGTICGAEALVRWEHPKLGTISPVEFVPIAEANGDISKLGYQVLLRACRDALNWPDHIKVSVNVSPIQLAQSDFFDQVLEVLEISGLKQQRLELEITETSLLDFNEKIFEQLNLLNRSGISIAIDDFGIGYSSFEYLVDFEFDKIKLDRKFIKNIIEDPASQKILRAIKVLSDGLGVKLLCEGVSTEHEYSAVMEVGCDEIQGYHFGRPMVVADMNSMLKKQEHAFA